MMATQELTSFIIMKQKHMTSIRKLKSMLIILKAKSQQGKGKNQLKKKYIYFILRLKYSKYEVYKRLNKIHFGIFFIIFLH